LAAGNEGVNAGTTTPSRLNATNVYTISAVDSKDCMPSWSNWGNPPVDYAAPGVSVVSLRRGGGTTSMSGTSMAAPHAAGVLLLGAARSSGSASCDPDGNPDPIIHR
jgi:subtilisin family serine protease